MARHRFFTLCPELLCSLGFDGFFRRVNPAFTETLGYAEGDLRSRPFLEIVAPSDQTLLERELRRLKAGPAATSFELRCRCQSGEIKWLAVTAKSYPDERLIYAAARDTTAQKVAEEKLRRYNEELQALSKAAQAATAAKSDFLANVSHELRTPMTAILTVADLLAEQATPEQLEGVHSIQRNGQYLLSLISEVLDLSKIESGKLLLERIPCSPREIVFEVEDSLRPQAEQKGLALKVEYLGQIPRTIQSDPTRIRQVLTNLLDNAIKFTERGEVALRVSLSHSAQQPVLLFEISDSGIGMSQDQIDHLFEPFTQADASTTRKFGGTGLGLSISGRLARLLRGDITVESELGAGSTFRFSVATGDLSGVPMAEVHGRYRRAPRRTPTEPAKLSGRVLLAEDYVDIQRPVAYVLQRAGLDVEIAENGGRAVELATLAGQQGRPFDVILMDMQMPQVDGYTATRQLREMGYDGAIVAITAHAMECDRQKCLQAGCDEYLTKPLNMSRLLEVIAGLIRRGFPALPETASAEPLASPRP